MNRFSAVSMNKINCCPAVSCPISCAHVPPSACRDALVKTPLNPVFFTVFETTFFNSQAQALHVYTRIHKARSARAAAGAVAAWFTSQFTIDGSERQRQLHGTHPGAVPRLSACM